ncbi:MaoC/PaaZ C-terminal domain-containing protein [Streptomyces sp. NBC_01410]|uniref:MaoC/PaaZ C-terminal domain-containing protein n=1 Tax=Streptomyces sp. NBC_01410 TaxID=2903856 RepID=UPI003256014A
MTSAVQTPEDYGVLTGFQTVSAVDVRRFRDMLGMAEGARHEGGQPGAGTVPVPPSPSAPLGLVAAAALRATADLLTRSAPPDGMVLIHGAQKLCVYRPVSAGAELASTASVRSVRPLGGGIATEVLVQFATPVGEPVAESTSLVVRTPPTAPPPAPRATAAGAPAATGEPSGQEPVRPDRTASFTVTRELVGEYAAVSGDHNPIHLSELAARAAGFPDIIAHGMLTFALTAHHLAGLAGDDRVSEIQWRFSKPLTVPAEGAALALSCRPLPAGTEEKGGLLLTATDGAGSTIARGRAVVAPPSG